mgnify:CR=1 FL=1
MRFSIIIPTHNRKDLLRHCLEAVTCQDYPDYEVIVVDDGSTDGTGEMVQHEFPQVHYLRQEPNRGPAAARNRGIEAATGQIIAFTDDDCRVPPDWLSRLADGYQRYPQVVGVGGYLEAPEEVLASNIFAQYERYMARHMYHVSEEECLDGFECPAGGTNNMSYRRAVLQEVSGFDESFPYAAGEDADLKWRICEQGHPILFIPVRAIHLQSYCWDTFSRQCYVRGRGRTFFEAKHHRKPGYAVIGLRLARRFLSFTADVITMPDRRLAVVKLADGVYGCLGQWAALRGEK